MDGATRRMRFPIAGAFEGEIALIIGISRNTVNNYITSIMNKTGAKTRSEAVAFAVRQRII